MFRRTVTFAAVVGLVFALAPAAQAEMGYYDVADGFASLDALGQNGTTGGAGGQVVTVTNATDFATYANSEDPYIIRVVGTIYVPEPYSIDIKSNKTIVGVGDSAQVVGGAFFLRVEDEPHNIIIRNLHFHDSIHKGIAMGEAHHVWIDHCKFSNNGDACLDSKDDSTYLTVSWSIFENHNKTFGIGWTENLTAQMTLHHNWFKNVVQRNPSCDNVLRAHVYNFYQEDVSSYGVYSRGSTNMILENSLFESVNNPHYVQDGTLVATGCVYTDCTWSSGVTKQRGPAFFDPSEYYDYTLDNAADLPDILSAYAGPQQAFEDPPPPWATGQIDINDPLVPSGLGVGDEFQLAFVTSTKGDGQSGDIADYNAFVQSAADAAGIGASKGVAWRAIASTPTDDARDNASVTAPVYTTEGVLVATGDGDMWDGGILVAIDHTEYGILITADSFDKDHNYRVRTGTELDGTGPRMY